MITLIIIMNEMTMEFLKKPVFYIQGGGVTKHGGCKTYVDLIVSDLSHLANQHPQLADLFKTFSSYKQGEANFGFAEIKNDLRLFNNLSRTTKGQELYQSLVDNMPLISVSNDVLGNPENTKNVSLIPLIKLNQNPIDTLTMIYDLIENENTTSQGWIIEKIQTLNKIIILNPSAFGVGININAIIDKWIKNKKG